MDKHQTPVVFRVDRAGEVFALFPTLPADVGGRYCVSFVHVGQHGAADYRHCIKTSRPATAAEYAGLAAELKGRGYNLDVVTRATPAHRSAFDTALMDSRK